MWKMFRFFMLMLIIGSFPYKAFPEEDRGSKQTVHAFLDEQLHYSIDFLVFKRLASARLSFRATEVHNIFRAELVGRTLGIAAWLTNERTQRYVSYMQLMPDGHLRSLEHESQIIKRKDKKWQKRGKRYRFDYLDGKVYQDRSRGGRYLETKAFDLPVSAEAADILTAFYNLRARNYGRLLPGDELSVPTFSSKGFNMIDIRVLTAEERLKQPFFPRGGTLLHVHIDPEVFETGSGDLYVWFDESGEPKRGIVVDVIGLGDVRGYFQEAKND